MGGLTQPWQGRTAWRIKAALLKTTAVLALARAVSDRRGIGFGIIDRLILVNYNRSMLDDRRSPRYRTMAHAQISGVLEGECLLRNISITGCCVECSDAADIQPNAQYQLKIKPEGSSHIGSFQLEVECKWVRNDRDAAELGFAIIASPKGKKFQRYVDYLAYRHSHS